jgi:TPR repeat protein
LSALDLGNAMAYAPSDFVGAMEARVDLRAHERVLDSQVLRLEWVPKQPEAQTAVVSPAEAAPQPLAPDEIAGLLKRGEEFLRTGDIASARLLLRRAAHAGNADAALALGGTYDGAVLAKLGVLGFARNADQARFWYQKAADLGSQVAAQRLETLGSAGK